MQCQATRLALRSALDLGSRLICNKGESRKVVGWVGLGWAGLFYYRGVRVVSFGGGEEMVEVMLWSGDDDDDDK